MKLNDYQRLAAGIVPNQVTQYLKEHPERAEAINSHAWSLDISDMVIECAGCLAVLHAGERRHGKCSGKWGVP